MKYDPIICDQCGETARGTLEKVWARADFGHVDRETGEFEYDGDTEVFWDSQETEKHPEGGDMLTCPNGHEWPATFIPDEEEAQA